jgi:hypothetical protein
VEQWSRWVDGAAATNAANRFIQSITNPRCDCFGKHVRCYLHKVEAFHSRMHVANTRTHVRDRTRVPPYLRFSGALLLPNEQHIGDRDEQCCAAARKTQRTLRGAWVSKICPQGAETGSA